jgi:hypothetical protein
MVVVSHLHSVTQNFVAHYLVVEHATPVGGHKDQVNVHRRNQVYPDALQRQRTALASAFGCARVVWNDCLRARTEAHAAGCRT